VLHSAVLRGWLAGMAGWLRFDVVRRRSLSLFRAPPSFSRSIFVCSVNSFVVRGRIFLAG